MLGVTQERTDALQSSGMEGGMQGMGLPKAAVMAGITSTGVYSCPGELLRAGQEL